MILIDDVLIADDILESHFVCDLNKCKGACCWEGDYGAPIEPEEIDIISDVLPVILPRLSQESRDKIANDDFKDIFGDEKFVGTQLLPNGACVFLTKDKDGISKCAFEQANEEGEIDFRKPISCHLYPIRRTVNKSQGFQALNYDVWEICTAACSLGKKLKVPLYQFAKDSLTRLYGADFYERLDGYWQELHAENQD